MADAAQIPAAAVAYRPPAYPAVLATIEMVQRDLCDGVHVYRYLHHDGLPGDEGAFLLCSYWLLDALVHAGRLDDAEALLERLLDMAHDGRMYSERGDPSTGEQLGNTPQAFTHMAVRPHPTDSLRAVA